MHLEGDVDVLQKYHSDVPLKEGIYFTSNDNFFSSTHMTSYSCVSVIPIGQVKEVGNLLVPLLTMFIPVG